MDVRKSKRVGIMKKKEFFDMPREDIVPIRGFFRFQGRLCP